MPKALTIPDEYLARRHSFFIDDDFEEHVTADRWTSLAADVGSSVAVGAAENGTVVLTTGATDNNEAAVSLTQGCFKLAAGKPHELETLLQYAEAATDDANVFHGFIEAAVGAANTMADNGAGPAADFDGAAFFKTDGGLNWNIVVSNGTTQTKVELTAANSLDKLVKVAGGSAQQRLAIQIMPKDATKADVLFFINDTLVYKITDWTFPTSNMTVRTHVKAGGATSEVVNVDRIFAGKKR